MLPDARMRIYGSSIGVEKYQFWHPYGGTINFELRIETDFSYLHTPVQTTSEQCLAAVNKHEQCLDLKNMI